MIEHHFSLSIVSQSLSCHPSILHQTSPYHCDHSGCLFPSAFLHTTLLHTPPSECQRSSFCHNTHSLLQFGIPHKLLYFHCHTVHPNHTVCFETHPLPIALLHHSNPAPDCAQLPSPPLHPLAITHASQHPLPPLDSSPIQQSQRQTSQRFHHSTDWNH